MSPTCAHTTTNTYYRPPACWDCPVWDQRIPNQPIFERNFLLYQPPIVTVSRPANTSFCQLPIPALPDAIDNRRTAGIPTAANPDYRTLLQPWVNLPAEEEPKLALYWWQNTVNQGPIGIQTTAPATSGFDDRQRPYVPVQEVSFAYLLARYPHRPWLRGTRINRPRESDLQGINYINPKDLPVPERTQTTCYSTDRSDYSLTQLMQNQLCRRVARYGPVKQCKLWHNITKPKMLYGGNLSLIYPQFS